MSTRADINPMKENRLRTAALQGSAGLVLDNKLNMNNQCILQGLTMHWLNQQGGSKRTEERSCPLYLALVWLHLEYWAHLTKRFNWAHLGTPQQERDFVQLGISPAEVWGLEQLIFDKVSLSTWRKLRRSLIAVLHYIVGGCREESQSSQRNTGRDKK